MDDLLKFLPLIIAIVVGVGELITIIWIIANKDRDLKALSISITELKIITQSNKVKILELDKISGINQNQIKEQKITLKDYEKKIVDHRKECKCTAERVHSEIEKRVEKTECLKEVDNYSRYNIKVCNMIEKLDSRMKNMELSLNTLATKYETEMNHK